MARRDPLPNKHRRLLKITARRPLASVANLAPVLGLDEEGVRRMLDALAARRLGHLGGARHDAKYASTAGS